MENSPTIIPIASGKGGVGKSLLAANLSIALAQMGHQTVVMDLDFGGSNLYSFLGLRNSNRGIGDYLNDKQINLEELRVGTDWPNLEFIPGDGQTPFLANLGHAQKSKLIKHIRQISAKFIILDLGAGSTFNTLDFFLMSKRGLIITSPEKVALMNMLVFLKNVIYRAIVRSIPKKGPLEDLVKTFFRKSMQEDQTSLSSLIDKVRVVDDQIAHTIQNFCTLYSPRVIFNQVRHPEKIGNLASLSQLVKKTLTTDIHYFGVVFHDETILESIETGIPLLNGYPSCPSARCIKILAGRIHKMWNDKFENSAQKLLENTKILHDKLFSLSAEVAE